MYAFIKLKNGEFIEVFDLQVIKRTRNFKPLEEITDFSSFVLYNAYNYVFVGSLTLSVSGESIEYVTFKGK